MLTGVMKNHVPLSPYLMMRQQLFIRTMIREAILYQNFITTLLELKHTGTRFSIYANLIGLFQISNQQAWSAESDSRML